MAEPIINVRSHRRRWALGQDELASLLGISQSTYSRIENGEIIPDVRLLIGLCVVFGLSLRRMFPALYHHLEEIVMARAATLDHKWGRSSRHTVRQKRRLLTAMAYRAKGNSADA